MYKNNLRKIRQEKNMTIRDLAEKSGVSTGYICHLEKGSRKNPTIEVMEKLAKALGEQAIKIFF